MPKPEKAEKRGKRRNVKPSKGITSLTDVQYIFTTDVDTDEPGEVSVSHDVLADGALMFSADMVWHGLDDEIKAAMITAMASYDIEDSVTESKRFRDVLNQWKRQIKALSKINQWSHKMLSKQEKQSGLVETEEIQLED